MKFTATTLVLLGLLVMPCVAQTYVSTPGALISNSLPTTQDSIVVSGAPTAISTLRVELNITHTWDSDLDIFLIPPGGTPIELTTDNGGSGDDYTGTIFTGSLDACWTASGPITGGSAPFTGTWTPEDLVGFDALYGSDGNGTWTLDVTDDFAGDDGTLDSWSISFDGPTSFPPFVSSPGSAISSSLPPTTDSIVLTCAPTAISILRVELNVLHTWVSDLDITLTPPGGTPIALTLGNGGSGDNFIRTGFTGTGDPCNVAGSGSIIGLGSSAAPFTGTYTPEDLTGFELLYGTNASGSWTLSITDNVSGDDGTLLSWSLDFENTMKLHVYQTTAANLINVDMRCGTPGAQFVNVFSFDPANTGLAFGSGPFFGLHADLATITSQLIIGTQGLAPWGGLMDAVGSYFWSGTVAPGGPLAGTELFGLCIEVDSSYNITGTALTSWMIL